MFLEIKFPFYFTVDVFLVTVYLFGKGGRGGTDPKGTSQKEIQQRDPKDNSDQEVENRVNCRSLFKVRRKQRELTNS